MLITSKDVLLSVFTRHASKKAATRTLVRERFFCERNAVKTFNRTSAEPTWGSETSQYPQEKKSIEITLVAASERVRGQTLSLLRGL